MLERINAREGVVIYRSPLLGATGAPHGFSTRIGGVSTGPFESLNLGNPNGAPVQDSSDNIATNYRRLHAAVGASERRRLYVHQVHGDAVETATDTVAFDCGRKADAIVTRDVAAVAAVRVADCVPVLLATVDGRCVAAVHAGWRGVVAGVALRAVDRLRDEYRRGVSVDTTVPPVVAAIGPSISFSAFEVGPEVAAEFERVFAGEAHFLLRSSQNAGKAMIDLRQGLRMQLRSAGVTGIDMSEQCTVANAAEFFSHRRDQGITGRMAALIGPAA